MTVTAVEQDNLIKLYMVTFDRAPDVDGLNFWKGQLDSGASLLDVSRSMLVSQEWQNLYPSSLPTGDLVDQAYNNLFDRDPEPFGKDYWVDQLNSGAVSRASFFKALIDGAEANNTYQGQLDSQLVTRKTEVSEYFALEKGLNHIDKAQSILDAVESGTPISEAKAELDQFASQQLSQVAITLDPTGIEAADGNLNGWVTPNQGSEGSTKDVTALGNLEYRDVTANTDGSENEDPGGTPITSDDRFHAENTALADERFDVDSVDRISSFNNDEDVINFDTSVTDNGLLVESQGFNYGQDRLTDGSGFDNTKGIHIVELDGSTTTLDDSSGPDELLDFNAVIDEIEAAVDDGSPGDNQAQLGRGAIDHMVFTVLDNAGSPGDASDDAMGIYEYVEGAANNDTIDGGELSLIGLAGGGDIEQQFDAL